MYSSQHIGLVGKIGSTDAASFTEERVNNFCLENRDMHLRVAEIAFQYIDIIGRKQEEGHAEWTFKEYEIEDEKIVIAQFSVRSFRDNPKNYCGEDIRCCFPVNYLWAEDAIAQMREEKAQKDEKKRLEDERLREEEHLRREANDLLTYQRLKAQFEGR